MLSTNIDLEKQQQQQQTSIVKNPFDYFQKYYQYVWIFSFTIPLTFPLILILSDIVGHPPVACYFSMFIDLLSILAFITGFFRYKQLQFLLINKNFDNDNNDSKKQCLQNLNYNSLISLWITSFGLLMIGNFRETENMFVHIIGFFVFWLPITYYMFIMIKLNDNIDDYKNNNNNDIIIIKLLTWLSTITLSIFVISIPISSYKHGNLLANFDNQIRQHWPKNDSGYIWHTFGAINEWIGFLTLMLFFSLIGLRLRSFKYY
ncbi:uncharacterized protein LOC142646079 isoform X2 [Dermatophagoides pteronyssinus]|uniref:uncharacterized protein LOC142646079 isoform X2 n=1 Tax=Dermatophagoides pteronyssinus TaxID=6956 RepID=UPI003F6669B8